MDFNIITFHDAHNHGAVLQAYALQSFIESLGYTAGIFDYRSPGNSTLKGKLLSFSKVAHLSDYKKKECKFEDFIRTAMHLNLEKNSRVFITGSDQVWNPIGLMDPAFFLDFVSPNTLKASYAASMGVKTIPEEKKDLIKKHLLDFAGVSVREKDVKTELKDLYTGDIDVHIDPTLLFDKNFWKAEMRKPEGIPDKYIFVYALKALPNLNRLIEWLKKEHQAPVILIDEQGIIGYQVKHDIVRRDIGPREFVWLIANAQAVISTSFHGTVFSILFEKELYPVINPKMPSRIENLLEFLELPNVPADTIRYQRHNQVNWSEVHKKLEQEREKSRQYIHRLNALATMKEHKQNINDSFQSCVGCGACKVVCPMHAITMGLNEEGFYAPTVDHVNCISCGKCLKICPVLNSTKYKQKIKGWCAWNTDSDILEKSSSGGVFYSLAQKTVADGGVVFGAVYEDKWRSVIITSSDQHKLDEMMKSKYIASDVDSSYEQVKRYLDNGKQVLYSGAPCQIAGLLGYLGGRPQNLVTVDFICGGMPSVRAWREHVDELERKYNSTTQKVEFRPKDRGWGLQSCLKIRFKNGKNYRVKRAYMDSYYSCFAREHINVREACLSCKFAEMHCADLTIADYWGYRQSGIPKNQMGMSLVVANTDRGVLYFQDRDDKMAVSELEPEMTDYAFMPRSESNEARIRRNSYFSIAKRIGHEQSAMRFISTSTISAILQRVRKGK